MNEQNPETAAKKVLFLTNSEFGQANVTLAVIYELLLRQKYDVHVVSFAPLERRISDLNDLASSHSSGKASAATFHLITGLSAKEASEVILKKFQFVGPFPPGLREGGAKDTYRLTLPAMASTWEGPAYMDTYTSCLDILDSVGPDLIVCDPLLSQGLDACKTRSRDIVILAPNTLREVMSKQQPFFSTLIKSPVLSSAYPYPVPWYLIPANIYLKICMIWILVTNPTLKELMKFRVSQNLAKLPLAFNIWQPENHYLVPAIPETDFPCYVAPNVTSCGPILLPEPPIEESDPKLLAWLQRRPTVLINLGSLIKMDGAMVREFAGGLKVLLDSRPDVQILWKLQKSGGISLLRNGKSGSDGGDVTAASLEAVEKDITSGRLRIEEWLSVNPIAIIQSGHVECLVHHGGSNSFHEALSVGIPQVILPCWMDTFDFANRVEYLGIGVYGSRNSSPRVEAKELSKALMRVMGGGKEADAMKVRAKELAEIAGKVGGRVRACDKIIEILEAS